MNRKKIKECWINKKQLFKNKKVILIGTLVIVSVIGLGGTGYILNQSDSKATSITKKNDSGIKEIDVKTLLDTLKAIDTSKLSVDDKKTLETKIRAIEDMISRKDYAESKKEIELVIKDTERKLSESNNKENIKTDIEKETESTEVTADSEKSSNSNIDNSTGVSKEENKEVVEDKPEYIPPTVDETPTPPIVEEPQPTPIPPIVEEIPEPVYPTLGEIKQRLISYGQSLGYTYSSSLEYSGFDITGAEQMWSSELGNSVDGDRLFGSMEGSEFGITVEDLGNGYVKMMLWIV